MAVWPDKLPKATVKARGGTVIQGRWVDIPTKGIRPLQVSGLDSWDSNSILALIPRSTLRPPPLGSCLVYCVASEQESRQRQPQHADVKMACVNTLAKRELYLELPREYPWYVEGQCIVGCPGLAFC